MICILNIGSGNLRSVKNALDYLKIKNTISDEKKVIKSSNHLIIPGDGAFGHAMNIIKKKKLNHEIDKFINDGKPVLGICLGFQILMQSSNEFSNNKGLSIFNYKVENLNFPCKTHIGLNTLIENSKNLKLLKNIKNRKFYFLHAFGVKKKKSIFKDKKVGFANFNNTKFLSIIEYKNIFATQFHPEKSGVQGLQLLKNFFYIKKSC
jgi:glutamine amidotransferase